MGSKSAFTELLGQKSSCHPPNTARGGYSHPPFIARRAEARVRVGEETKKGGQRGPSSQIGTSLLDSGPTPSLGVPIWSSGVDWAPLKDTQGKESVGWHSDGHVRWCRRDAQWRAPAAGMLGRSSGVGSRRGLCPSWALNGDRGGLRGLRPSSGPWTWAGSRWDKGLCRSGAGRAGQA